MRRRNQGLFAGDQNIKQRSARGTRQNPNGQRRVLSGSPGTALVDVLVSGEQSLVPPPLVTFIVPFERFMHSTILSGFILLPLCKPRGGFVPMPPMMLVCLRASSVTNLVDVINRLWSTQVLDDDLTECVLLFVGSCRPSATVLIRPFDIQVAGGLTVLPFVVRSTHKVHHMILIIFVIARSVIRSISDVVPSTFVVL